MTASSPSLSPTLELACELIRRPSVTPLDADCQALEPDGTPIAGLHVVGEAIGGIFAYDYIGGASLTRCVVSGMHVADGIAGK